MKNFLLIILSFLLIIATIAGASVIASGNKMSDHKPNSLRNFLLMFSEQGVVFDFDKTKLIYDDQLRIIKENVELIDTFQNEAFGADSDLEWYERIWGFVKWIAVIIWQLFELIITLLALCLGFIIDFVEMITTIFKILNYLFVPIKL